MIGIDLNVESQRTKKNRGFLPRGQRLQKFETMYIGDYEFVNISSFAVLNKKLWLEEDGDLKKNDPLYSFKFIRKLKIDTKCYHLLAITLYPT